MGIYGRGVSDDRRPQTDDCKHEWVPTGSVIGQAGRTLGSRCIHCGRYSYRPGPPAGRQVRRLP
jgi:hypothetical protein